MRMWRRWMVRGDYELSTDVVTSTVCALALAFLFDFGGGAGSDYGYLGGFRDAF
jgi:hypothetical protein